MTNLARPDDGQAQYRMNEATEPKPTLIDHDQDVLLRCPRLGHEINFGYCRQETRGKPCRLILDCWWERFDVRTFLRTHLPEEVMAAVEKASSSPPPAKMMSLLDLMEQTKARLASESASSEDPPKRQT